MQVVLLKSFTFSNSVNSSATCRKSNINLPLFEYRCVAECQMSMTARKNRAPIFFSGLVYGMIRNLILTL